MAVAKKKSAPVSEVKPTKFASLFAGLGKYLLGGLLLFGVTVFAGYRIWQFVSGKLLSSEEYQLTPEKILLSPWPMPKYVWPDPRIKVFEQLQQRGPVSIMDDDLVERVTAAFEQCPWIAKVHKVSKTYPATVKVELEYREPVLMVYIPNSRGTDDVYAVDANGNSLPTLGCFTELEIGRYPHLIGVDKPPMTGEGKRWGDSRVIGAAEIAAALKPVWEKLHLKHIVPRAISLRPSENTAEVTQSSQFGEYHFELIAEEPPSEGISQEKLVEKRILWGKSPVNKNSQDRSPAEKVRILEDHAKECGSLVKYRDEIDLNK